ncbi:MAG: hypothetical protein ACLPND_03595, partial [Candidatus Korobacteraceae bacterium]
MATLLSKLEAARLRYGPSSAASVEKLLGALKDLHLDDVESLIRSHDALLFLRAFPQSRRVLQLADGLLAGIAKQVARLRDSGADMELFEPEQVSGIAGTVISDTFTYELTCWLVQRYPNQLSVAWDIDEQGRQLAVSLPRFLPLLADDSLVEADTPHLDWLGCAAGGPERILPWLMQRLEDVPMTMLQKTAWYDSLKINVAWNLGDSAASRTRARRIPQEMYFHREPLIRRNEVSIEAELGSPPLPIRKLSRREGEEI